jgi:hypothetical protein
MKWNLKFKVPIGFTYTIQRHVNSLDIYVKQPDTETWEEVIVEKELLESWGGYGRVCGGARYLIKIKPKSHWLPVAIGEYSYQACIPSMPSIKNYAVTELRFNSVCDIKIIHNDGTEIIFYVRDISEFIIKDQ